MKAEVMKRKLLDNTISLAGNPTDCIRLSFQKNEEGDIIYSNVKEATVDSIIFPPLTEIPFRRITKDGTQGYKISPVTLAEEEMNQSFELVVPYASNIDVDDLIVRVFLDPANIAPTVLVLQVSELKGTFGQNMLLQTRVNCTLYAEDMRPEAVAVISEMAKRRLHLQF